MNAARVECHPADFPHRIIETLRFADTDRNGHITSGRDDQAGDRVAAHELAGAVHRAVEVRLLLDRAPPRARLLSVMRPLFRSASMASCLPGMASKREARRHLGDAARRPS